MAVARLSLSDFRSYADATIAPGPGFVILTGENGAGKTNVLEAVSLLSPGRGLRGASLARDGASAAARAASRWRRGWARSTSAPAPRPKRPTAGRCGSTARRPRPIRFRNVLSVLWLTPAMDRLFADAASGRRRFLDRLVLALRPSHAMHAARYDAAMRARNKLLAEQGPRDEAWLTALEARMAEHGAAIARGPRRGGGGSGGAARGGARRPVRPRRPRARRRRRGGPRPDARPRPRPRCRRRPDPRRAAPHRPCRHPSRQEPAGRDSARPGSRRRC